MNSDMFYFLFKDRIDAGKKLLSALLDYKNRKKTIVIGLPRGGVITANIIAKGLNLPLDLIIPRKIGAPFNSELAVGALCNDEIILDEEAIEYLHISQEYLKTEINKEKQEAKRRIQLYRKDRPPLILKNTTIILIDDGIATGATMKAAIKAIRKQNPKEIILAVPVAPPDVVEKFENIADKVVALFTPSSFMAIGQFYEIFDQIDDLEIIKIFSKKP